MNEEIDEDKPPAVPDPSDRLSVAVSHAGDGVVVELEGDLDPHTSPHLQELLDERLGDAERVTLQMAAVGFVDSAGLRVIANLARRGEEGREVVLADPSTALRKMLDVTGLSDHVEIR